MAKSELKARGLYIAEDLHSHEQYLVNVEGTSPMLYITNVISISEFVNSDGYSKENKLREAITVSVSNFSWTPLECKIAIKEPKKTIKAAISDYPSLSEKYDFYKELIEKGDDSKAIMELCINESIDVGVATELIKQFKLSLIS